MPLACSTRWTASGMVMKYRVISACVTVTGPPRSICALNVLTTEPRLPSTLPKRTTTNARPSSARLSDDRLRHALGRTHDARRGHGFVGRDQDEAFGHRSGAPDVPRFRVPMMLLVIGLFGVLFHERHVLVSGRMEDDGGPEPIEDLGQPTVVTDIGDHCTEPNLGKRLPATGPRPQRCCSRHGRAARDVTDRRWRSGGPARSRSTLHLR